MAYCKIVALSLLTIASNISPLHADDAAEAIDDVLTKIKPEQEELKRSLIEIKDILTAETPVDYKPKALAVVKILGKSLPNLNSGDGLKIAQGALDIVASIAEQFPGVGTPVAAVASLISAVLGLFTGAKVQKSTEAIVREVMRETSDEELEGDVRGAQEKLSASMDYLRPKKGTKLGADEARDLSSKLLITTGLGVIGKVSHRIDSRKHSNVPAEAKQAIKFVMLYCQLLTMRDLLYREMIDIVKQSDAPNEAKSLVSVRDGRLPVYRDTLLFLTEPEGSIAGALSFYYPPGKDTQSVFIKTCLKFVQLPTEPPNLDFLTSGHYRLSTMRYPDHVNEADFNAMSTKHIRTALAKHPINAQTHIFSRTDDGYWHIRLYESYAATDGQWAYVTDSVEGDKSKFLIIKLRNGHLIISPKDHPGKFWQVQGDWVGLTEGNPGDEGYFKALPKIYRPAKKDKKKRKNKKKKAENRN